MKVNSVSLFPIAPTRQFAVKVSLGVLCLVSLASSSVSLSRETTDSEVLVARGVLSRNGKAGNLWILKTNNSPRFRDEAILEVTFTTRVGQASIAYAPYEGKQIELVGEVKEVFHGNAVLRKVRTIGILDFPDLSTILSGVPKGCEACYVPLLVSRQSLEEIAQGDEAQHCVFAYTFERNSIWEIKGAMPVDAGAIETQPRIIHLNGESYRYQEISPTEGLHLLEKPDGTIPISRPMIINKIVPGASLSELKADFRALLRVVPANQN